MEFAILYTFVQKIEPVAVPIQHFNFVAMAVMEYKNCVRQGTKLEILFYNA